MRQFSPHAQPLDNIGPFGRHQIYQYVAKNDAAFSGLYPRRS